MAVGEYLGNGNPDGTSCGRSSSDKFSFHGVTPVARYESSALVTISYSPTSGGFGFTTSAQFQALLAKVNAIQDALELKGITLDIS